MWRRLAQRALSGASAGAHSSRSQQKQSNWRRYAWAAAGVPVVVVGTAAAADEGVARSLYFNAHAMPVLAHYRLVEFYLRLKGHSKTDLVARGEAFAPLHERYAPLSLHVMRTLKGFYVKIGQMGATRSDFVAMPYIKVCETLQDNCPYEPLEKVQELLTRTLGRPWSEVFTFIDPQPLGAASIGQVHRAVLRDGRVVAVKVQYPNVERLFRGDMRTIRRFCELAQPEQLPALAEIERAFVTEFDYQREADMLEQVAVNVSNSPYRRACVVPRPIRELCTKHMLVMEYLDGKKLVDALREQAAALASAQGLTLDQLRDQWADRAAAAGTTPSARPTAPVATPRWRRAALRVALWVNDVARGTRTPMPLDVDSVLALLAGVHAHTIFVNGLYNGDSHPGNVMLLKDGRIGLIDFGQTRSLTLTSRKNLARIIVALADGDKAAAVAAMRATGYRTRHNDDDMCWRMASISFDRDDREITLGLDLQQFMEHQNEVDPMEVIDDTLVMPSRNTLLLRGLAIALGRPISVAKAWRAEAARFLAEHPDAV